MGKRTKKKHPMERFVEKIILLDNGCWQWVGAKNNDGYGHMGVECKSVGAHTWIYEYIHGVIPAGLEVDHLCRNRSCVNPDHLETVTHAENIRRSMFVLAHRVRSTHCIHGHEFTVKNTYTYPNGYRACHTCMKTYHHNFLKRRGRQQNS